MSIHPDARSPRTYALVAACLLAGLAGEPIRAETAKPITIKTADGIPLTGADGAPSGAAAELGLANIVGWGPADVAGLAGIVGRSNLAEGQREITLTIDSRAQKLVQETLVYHVTRLVDDKDKPRRFFNDRRAAFVLMDADTGAIVAVGSWPPPANAGPAEFERLARTPASDDPLSIPAWRAPAKNYAAGTSIKALVALAAALEASDSAAKPDDRIAPMLLGMDRATYRRRLGVEPAAASVPIPGSPYSIANIGESTAMISGPLRSLVCHGDAAVPVANTLNVSLALKHSYHTYFARLALLLEERSVAAWSKGLPTNRRGDVDMVVFSYPETRLAQRFAQLGISPSASIDLAANLGAAAPLARIRGDTLLDRLFVRPAASLVGIRAVLPGGMRARNYRADCEFRIALGGIGEAWNLTPLHPAMGAAAIARGARVHPHLVAAAGATKLVPPPGEKLAVRADLLGAIQLGMKAVAEAPGATMSGVARAEPNFVLGQEYAKVKDGDIGRRVAALRQESAKQGVKPTWCRLFAKTGTADGAIPGVNTGWVMGWKEPLLEGGRRFAFACMVSHLDHAYGGPRFGGAVCGALLRDIGFSLEAMSAPDLKAN